MRQADPRADLGLRQVLAVAHEDDLTLCGWQAAEAPGDRVAALDEVELVVVARDALAVARRLILVNRDGNVERCSMDGGGGLERVQDLLDRDPKRRGELAWSGRTTEAERELLEGPLHGEGTILVGARDVHGPAEVAEVVLQLPHDRRYRKCRERRTSFWVKAVDRVEQSDARDLREVVKRLGASVVSPREAVCEREEPPNQLVAGRGVAEARVPPKQALHACGVVLRRSAHGTCAGISRPREGRPVV